MLPNMQQRHLPVRSSRRSHLNRQRRQSLQRHTSQRTGRSCNRQSKNRSVDAHSRASPPRSPPRNLGRIRPLDVLTVLFSCPSHHNLAAITECLITSAHRLSIRRRCRGNTSQRRSIPARPSSLQLRELPLTLRSHEDYGI